MHIHTFPFNIITLIKGKRNIECRFIFKSILVTIKRRRVVSKKMRGIEYYKYK